ncbi:MAG TPA: hypothetical protein VGL86_21745 [Polyangia bacterium]|jgi:hypothetical protein
MAAAELRYDKGENIVFIRFAEPTELVTHKEIAAHFERVVTFWRRHARGKKSYFVVDIDNININMKELEFYAAQTDKAHHECAITSVRYGGNPLHRTLTRLAGMKIHRPSNLYATREEAMDVVRALRAGELRPDTG